MRILIVAAHPDDETIGASAVLGSRAEVSVVHVTSGAPRDPRWWPRGVSGREAYAAERAREAQRALSIVGIAPIALGFADLETMFSAAAIAGALRDVIARERPDLILTHAYEGGHPDHDTVALCVARAAARSVAVYEMALYHGAGGTLRTGELLGGSRPHALDRAQVARRRAMLAAYHSQRDVIARFTALEHECYRLAPAYDFTRPPHDGTLLYEHAGMASGEVWRRAAAGGAVVARGVLPCSRS